MKSTQTQYNELREGNMSQANFMRNIRMTFPHLVSNVTNFDDSVKILKNKGLISETKKDDSHLCNPVEVDLGLKIEVAKHDGNIEKAKKTIYANLKKNSSYYSQLNLSGQAVEPEKTKKPSTRKKKDANIDAVNGMKKVKDIVKESQEDIAEVDINVAGNERPNPAVLQAAQLIDMNNTLKALSDNITLQNAGDEGDGVAILKFNYWEELPQEAIAKLEAQFDVEADSEDHDDKNPTIAYILTVKPQAYRQKNTQDLGAAFEKFKSTLEQIVREVVNEESNK